MRNLKPATKTVLLLGLAAVTLLGAWQVARYEKHTKNKVASHLAILKKDARAPFKTFAEQKKAANPSFKKPAAQPPQQATPKKVLGTASAKTVTEDAIARAKTMVADSLARHGISDSTAKLADAKLDELQKFIDDTTKLPVGDQEKAVSQKKQEIHKWASENKVPYYLVNVLHG